MKIAALKKRVLVNGPWDTVYSKLRCFFVSTMWKIQKCI